MKWEIGSLFGSACAKLGKDNGIFAVDPGAEEVVKGGVLLLGGVALAPLDASSNPPDVTLFALARLSAMSTLAPTFTSKAVIAL